MTWIIITLIITVPSIILTWFITKAACKRRYKHTHKALAEAGKKMMSNPPD